MANSVFVAQAGRESHRFTNGASLASNRSESLSADIHPLGAQLFALCDGAGCDLQWNGAFGHRFCLIFPTWANVYRVAALYTSAGVCHAHEYRNR
jgi:hypothetical protein